MQVRTLPLASAPTTAPLLDELRAFWTRGKELVEVELATGDARTHGSRSKGAPSPAQQALGVGRFLEWGLARKKRAKLWVPKGGKLSAGPLDVGHEAPIAAGTFVGERVVTGDEAGTVVVSDGTDVAARFTVPHAKHGRIRALWALPGERLLVAGGDDGNPRKRGALATYSLAGERIARHGEVFAGTAKCFAIHGRSLAMGYAVGQRLHLVDLDEGSVRTLEVPEADVATLAFSADGTVLFAATKGGWAWALLDVASGEVCAHGGATERRGLAALHAPSGTVVEWRGGALRAEGETLLECAAPRLLTGGGAHVVAPTADALLVVE